MKYFIRVLCTPHCWLMLGKYDRTWDKELRELILHNKFRHVRTEEDHAILTRLGFKREEFEAYLGYTKVWIKNYPYGAFNKPGDVKKRPSRRTVIYAMDCYKRDLG